MEPPRIAVLLPSFRAGGAQKMLLNIATEITELGYELDLPMIRTDGPFEDKTPEDANVIDLGGSRAITCLPSLVSYLRDTEPDVLLTSLEAPNLIAIWAKHIAGVDTRVVIRVANVNSQRREQRGKRRILPFLERHTYCHADRIVAISNGVERDLVQQFSVPRELIEVIHNPAFSADILSLREEQPDHEWFHNDDLTVILGVGRLVPQKDFGTLIDAFDHLRTDHDAKLLILGEGEQRPDLERRIAKLGLTEDVSLPGFVDNPYKYMYHADLFVLSSMYEGFGNVIVEALACETPVVSTDCPGGPSEILQNGAYGQLVDVGDPAALAAAMSNALAQDTDPTALLERARDFSVSSITEQYLSTALPSADNSPKR